MSDGDSQEEARTGRPFVEDVQTLGKEAKLETRVRQTDIPLSLCEALT